MKSSQFEMPTFYYASITMRLALLCRLITKPTRKIA